MKDKRQQLIDRMKEASTRRVPTNLPLPTSPDVERVDESGSEPVAIIGLSGIFPQCHSVQEFWKALDEGRSLIEEIPNSRMDWNKYYDPSGHDKDKMHTKWGGFIPDVSGFDAEFFGILPSEAEVMDPRRRLLLMSAYHAMEDAGYAPNSFRKKDVGVFVAVEEDEYRQCLIEAGMASNHTANSSSLIANQLSYYFDLRGPSEIINTMCSGAAVAIHRAVSAIRSGEISYGLVGAANLLLHPDTFIYLSRTGQMSRSILVKSFGQDANGFLRAEGVGTVLLKSLKKAVADGDPIYALIRNTSVNFNGQGGLSMAAPNINAHAGVVQQCYEEAGINPQRVKYIEAQGMGNPVADIAEWEAFNKSLNTIAQRKGQSLSPGNCIVSTTKPTTGHMHAASALAALFKIIGSLQAEKIYAIHGFSEVNPDLVTGQACKLATETKPWPKGNSPRMAGLHSYGSGGNNAHILIEEYIASAINTRVNDEAPFVIPVSAKSELQCREILNSLLDYIDNNDAVSMHRVARTLQDGRDAMDCRVAFVGMSKEDFVSQARAYLEHGVMHQGNIASQNPLPTTADFSTRAEAWMTGKSVTWVHNGWGDQPRLHLPVYPFNCKSYWFQKSGSAKPDIQRKDASCKLRGSSGCVQERGCTSCNRKPEAAIGHIAQNQWTVNQAEQIIQTVLASFLKKPSTEIELDTQFSTMGFDSLLAVTLTTQLQERTGVTIKTSVIFEHTTPRHLAQFISKESGANAENGVARSLHPAKPIQRANAEFLRSEKAAAALSADQSLSKPSIAIVGLAGSFPQSPDLDAFWENILNGKSCVEEIPSQRWSSEIHFEPNKIQAAANGKSYGKWGGFLEQAFVFDPLFFNISPSEADTMNPKERLFLQCSWHVLEDAGYTPASLSGEQVGVFAGVTRSGIDPYNVSIFPVANRVSYTFNFKGPSMAFDTACSSSLIAIHEGCQHILSGECSVAIAGGVHVFLGPSHFAALSSLQMMSPDGVTRSFGAQANGMVPGEGVGAVLLKTLEKAIADGDHIYGIIRGSATNHGGKSNGFTVPNPKAHTALIETTLKRAGVDARNINYVEAHGTGTSLGDPIEVRGLTEAFRSSTPDSQFCPIGSIKSNIGHLEAAAGISGLTKVLLQMKHRTIVPTLHATATNSEIDFEASPFFIPDGVTEWNPVDAKGMSVPRLACISSFGAGGSNAHIIVEEFGDVRREDLSTSQKPVVVVLSAKTEIQLTSAVQKLLSFLRAVKPENENRLLRDVTCTLQLGREPMDDRLAIVTTSLSDLQGKLSEWLGRSAIVNGLHAGNIKKFADFRYVFSGDQTMDMIVDGWLRDGNLDKLAAVWVKGIPVDWSRLYPVTESLPQRISLPLYPFLKEYFPLPTREKVYDTKSDRHNDFRLHPLVHRNISTFNEQKFKTTLRGDEFFLTDHRINGRMTLPGVAYLEMVYAAMHHAMQDECLAEMRLQLRNTAWVRPVVISETPVTLITNLRPDDAGVEFSVTSFSEEEQETITHFLGRLEHLSEVEGVSTDLRAFDNGEKKFSAEQCYSLFESMGISYGPAHRAIESLQINEGEAIVKLSLPASVGSTLGEYWLHPSLLDAATQSIMALIAFDGDINSELPLALPFSIQELVVHKRCSTHMYAVTRYTNGKPAWSNHSDINTLSFDIDLFDDNGSVAIEVKGFTSRLVQREKAVQHQDLVFVAPAWKPATRAVQSSLPFAHHVVFYPGNDIALPTGMMEGINFVPIDMRPTSAAFFASFVDVVFALVQDSLVKNGQDFVLMQLLVPGTRDFAVASSLSALFKTAHIENPLFHGQVITFDQDPTTEFIKSEVIKNRLRPDASDVRYEKGVRLERQLEVVEIESAPSAPAWSENGVYLITGGTGAIGIIFAEEIARNTRNATVILTGRSALTNSRSMAIQSLRADGCQIEYIQSDISNHDDVVALVKTVLDRHGKLTGILHCAGIVKDGFIVTKESSELKTVLAPKVSGLINLDEVTKDLPLEMVVVFSSAAAMIGNAGQADYAIANAFMDCYARSRNVLVANNERSGRTVSINWPLWESGGMGVDERLRSVMRDTLGMSPMLTANGIKSFHKIINAGAEQMMVVQGDRHTLLRTLFRAEQTKENQITMEKNAVERRTIPDPSTNEVFKEKSLSYFKKLLSGVIKLSPERIDAAASMDQYGIDSIMVMQMTNQLEKIFGSLSKTLFFEYRSIEEITGYFLQVHHEKLEALFSPAGNAPREISASSTTNKSISPRAKIKASYSPVVTPSNRRAQFEKRDAESSDIAIIGVAGRYPMARNLREFWQNLCDGRNCITEIPKDRWDHTLYFDPDKNKIWKTNTKWGGFLDGVDEFDSLFFNISPREAEITDPQERLFLQSAYETIEDAGYTRQLLGLRSGQNRVGVFAGVMWTEYQLYGAQSTVMGKAQALSSSASSIANRVSYFCNFRGPSMAVDTMCSSSLTAIHLACQSIRAGECEVALAGGVNVSIHPNKYLVLGYGKLASSKGLCESFGKDGDGYVASEGVGTILLKPLKQAVADRDHIYGVIKATAINHGGKVNGYSVPNPRAQSDVIGDAIRTSGFDVRSISYVEAHGTGTALGDPIEMAGLSSSFGSTAKQFCAIGSVKSNIGHCESAAGVAGLTKVLLQMKHRQLVPSLHSATLNPNIDFENSPFFVQQCLESWKNPVISEHDVVRKFPLRAGVSSYGAGGSNAHILIEEYVPAAASFTNEALSVTSPSPALIVLSAKTEERLRASMKQFRDAIRTGAYKEEDLFSIAYTLQVGRENMEERVGFKVTSLQDLDKKLSGVLEGKVDEGGIHTGHVRSSKDILQYVTSDDEMSQTVEQWFVRGKYDKILGMWVNGLDVNWENFYHAAGMALPRRISLPSYPFSRVKYWPMLEHLSTAAGNTPSVVAHLHPLVQKNTSTLYQQQYHSAFNGDEFYLRDHIVNGKKLLPGAAHIEMVSEAFAMARGQKGPIRIVNLVWAEPVIVAEGQRVVHVSLSPADNGDLYFEIGSDSTGDETKNAVNSQGVISRDEPSIHPSFPDPDQFKANSDRIIESGELYALYANFGITYGPSHQSVDKAFIAGNEVLARLITPQSISATTTQFHVHPALLDGALQAVLASLLSKFSHDKKPPTAIPYSVEIIEVIAPFEAEMWAYIRRSPGRSDESGFIFFDIDVADNAGNVCLSMRGFTSRIVRGNVQNENSELLMFQPKWKPADSSIAADSTATTRIVFVLNNQDLVELLRSDPTMEVIALTSNDPNDPRDFERITLEVLMRVKRQMVGKVRTATLFQVVISDIPEQRLYMALSAMLKTAQLENPLMSGQLVVAEPGQRGKSIVELVSSQNVSTDPVIRLIQNRAEAISLEEFTPASRNNGHIWKDAGVYLITGGAGGLGLLFANEIASKASGATVILSGRSALDLQKENVLEGLRASGITVEYEACDVGDINAVSELVQKILSNHGRLNGIIHSAGVLRDSFMVKKDDAELRDVLKPKVFGARNLDVATANISLDFMVLCSSTTGYTGNAGQADYAVANAYLDGMAANRNNLADVTQRSGHTISVNWPFWKNGGMTLTEEQQRDLFDRHGIKPLDDSLAFEALYAGINGRVHQLIVLQGNVHRLRNSFAPIRSTNVITAPPPSSVTEIAKPQKDQAALPVSVEEYFKQVLSEAIKLPPEQIRVDKAMDEYGIDSVMVMRMTNALEKDFGSLSKTLFFEYQTIEELVKYFRESHGDKLKAVLKQDAPAVMAKSTEAPARTYGTPFRSVMKSNGDRTADQTLPKEARSTRDIAIVGLAGSYPQAKTISSFWNLLKEGRNSITEIPQERWNHHTYFDKEKNKIGKTYSKWGGFLEGVDEFDPVFFGITPKEAGLMDPQERLFLQCAYELLEDAGYTKDSLNVNPTSGAPQSIGVYVGAMNEEYQLYGAQVTEQGKPLVPSSISASIANRVSYYFNFNGPSLTLNTMCSSSLTTIHLACQSIQLGECHAAIAGGVNVTVHPNKYVSLSYGNFLSTKGLCESFGAGGDGYVPGEGVGAVLLKPLSMAIQDGDHIYGVIKGTAINHGGKTNGFTVPNPKAQVNVITKAMENAQFEAGTLTYLEAHGTGTKLGDPIEIAALTKALSANGGRTCAIGSVKSNIGHCEGAAGIAGVTKVLLQLKHRQLVPSLHAKELNPNIDFSNGVFKVQHELEPWEALTSGSNGTYKAYPRRAGVSAFGAGGSNAHILIEEFIVAPEVTASLEPTPAQPALIILSAKTKMQLKQRAAAILSWLNDHRERLTPRSLLNIAYTLQVGREPMDERLAFVAKTISELRSILSKYTDNEMVDGVFTGKADEQVPFENRSEELNSDLELIMKRWIQGERIDWLRIYSNHNGTTSPIRISLPTYPFNRKRCWFSHAPIEESRPIAKAAVNGHAKEVFLQKEWLAELDHDDRNSLRRVVVLCSPETKKLATLMMRRYQGSITVISENSATLSAQEWKAFDGLVDLTGYHRQDGISQQWLTQLQRAVEFGGLGRFRLLFVTKGLTNFNGGGTLNGAVQSALYRMLSSEYKHVTSHHVDMDPASGDEVAARHILDELESTAATTEVCYRGNKRYAPRLTELDRKTHRDSPRPLCQTDVLLITGGTRGLGFECARHFAEIHGIRRFVLIGKEPIPPREEWHAWAESETSVGQRIRNIRLLESLGAEVITTAVPLEDTARLEKAINEVKDKWKAIHGVIHCAGIADVINPAFIRKSLEDITTVLKPKVACLDSLYEALRHEPLSFFLLFSSVSSAIPSLGAGHSAYAMANAYMDHFAEAKSSHSPVISIQWPNWKQSGMGEVKSKRYQQLGFIGLSNDDALHLLDVILQDRPSPVVLPATVDLKIWSPETLLDQLPGKLNLSAENSKTSKSLVTAGKVAPNDSVRDWLLQVVSAELKLDRSEINVNKNFQDYGVDSIHIMQLLEPVKKTLSQNIDPSILYEFSTIESFSKWLAEKYPLELSQLFPGESAMVSEVSGQTDTRKPAITEKKSAGQKRERDDNEIVVVGMSCRFPGATDLDQYWQLLSRGGCGISLVPNERWSNPNGFVAGLVDNPHHFDPRFFLMREDDARAMDPQALMILEQSVRLFSAAGYTIEEVKGKEVGVYIGGRSGHSPDAHSLKSMRNPIVAVGQNYLAANVSQFFDFRGPSIMIDTACSSALVGMKMAIQALADGEIESAVVGGVSFLPNDNTHSLFSERGILNEGKDFHILDARAAGVVLGEGLGLVLIKTRRQADLDGDQIFASVKGIALNNDGRTAGPATPNMEAQKAVMVSALFKAGIEAGDVGYIEVNGSGSEVTDLIEIKSLNSVYAGSTAKVALGSAKPNIGHLLCAEGIAGFIKIVLMSYYGQLVPFRSGQRPMKFFDMASSPFYFAAENMKWKERRYAAMNCFADGGTNVHVIIHSEEISNDTVGGRRKPLPVPSMTRVNLRHGGKQILDPDEFAASINMHELMSPSFWEAHN